MGNRASRVAPTGTLHIIDSSTRARYQNQRELVQLRVKLRTIQTKHNDALSRLALHRHEVKIKSNELRHEGEQRQFYKTFDKHNSHNSSSFISASNLNDESDVSTLETPSLLLHNLNGLTEWEKSLIFPINMNKRKELNAFEAIRSQYKSKLDTPSRNPFKRSESFLLDDKVPLKKHTEQMKNSIQIAIKRAARDSNIIARRDAHIY